MSTKNGLVCIAAMALALLGIAGGQTALCQTRISVTVNNNVRQVVQGTAPKSLIANSTDAGRISGNQKLGRMLLLLAPSAKQDAAAAKTVTALHDPSSPTFHKWLTPAEFGHRFGVDEEDVAQVQQWLQSQGLIVNEVSHSRRFIVFSGNVSQVENAFSTQMHTYTYKDKSFISNSEEIQIPAALQSVVKGVVRLHSDPHSPALLMGGRVHFKKQRGHFTFDDGAQYMAPADFAKIYNVQPLYDSGIDGTGQSIAIVGRSNIDVQNVRDFRSLLGLPANDPQVIVNGDDPGQTLDMPEAMLDVTWAGAVAPKATIQFVVSQSNFADGVDVSAAYIVDHNLAPVMSTSFGECESLLGPVENAFYNSLWEQAAAEGITSFVSAGDNGGAGCDLPGGGLYASEGFAVSGIASTPYNVAVGGTQFDDTANPGAYWSSTTDPNTGASALGYIPEIVWNESSNDPNNVSLYAGSGGASTLYPKPEWQTALGVPTDGKRDLPDISLTAALHDGYLVCMYGDCSYGNYFYSFGGTSASSPSAAGIMALINQKMGGQRQGIANYIFYRLASVSGVYHDIAKGDDKVPDSLGQNTVGYSATPGYDLAAGLGSMDVNALVTNWQAAANGTNSTTTLALAGGQSSTVVHGTPINFQANVNCTPSGSCTAPTGSVSLSATSSSAATTAAGVGQLTSVGSGGVSNITTASVPGGNYSIAARYSGDGTYLPSTSTSVHVTVKPEQSQTYVGAMAGGSFTTGSISVGYGLPLSIGLVVAGKSGQGHPTGQLTLQADGQPITTSSYDGGTGTLNPNTLTLNYGENSSLLTGGPASQSSTVSYVVPSQALGAGTHQLVAAYPGDASFGPSQSSYNYTVTQATSLIADFFPVGAQVANIPVVLAGQVAFTNYGFAPYGGKITVTDITGPTPVLLGSGDVDSSLYGGSYSIQVTAKGAGTHILRVNFAGDANVKGSSGTYTVPFPGNADSSTLLTADVPNSTAGQAVTLTAMVASDVRLHSPRGTVTFLDGKTPIGAVAPDATGTAVLVTKTLAAGLNNITASYSGDAALNPSISGPVSETVADYLVQALPASLTIQEGQTGRTTLNMIPLGGFAQGVQLACSNLPVNVTCSFDKSSVTLDGVHPSTVSLTIHSNGSLASNIGVSGLWAVPPTMAVAGFFFIPFGRRNRINTRFIVLALVGLGLTSVGCGGGSGSKPGQGRGATYTFHVSANAGAGSTAKTVAVVVNVTK